MHRFNILVQNPDIRIIAISCTHACNIFYDTLSTYCRSNTDKYYY